tara:strand:+ start:82 stop:189 length:108 start_codon:yes stop_codon:yes gene_type:complete
LLKGISDSCGRGKEDPGSKEARRIKGYNEGNLSQN